MRYAYGKRKKKGMSRRLYTDEQIKEMEHMRYQKRMSLAAIAAVFNTTEMSIKKQLCYHGDYYGDARPLTAKPFDGWDFSDQNLPL